jgi:hypothetical protein
LNEILAVTEKSEETGLNAENRDWKENGRLARRALSDYFFGKRCKVRENPNLNNRRRHFDKEKLGRDACFRFEHATLTARPVAFVRRRRRVGIFRIVFMARRVSRLLRRGRKCLRCTGTPTQRVNDES